MSRQKDFFAIRSFDGKQHIHCAIVYRHYFSQFSMVDISNMESYKISPCRYIVRIIFFYILQRKIDFQIRELASLFCRIDTFEQIDRGYQNLEERLNQIGAKITRS